MELVFKGESLFWLMPSAPLTRFAGVVTLRVITEDPVITLGALDGEVSFTVRNQGTGAEIDVDFVDAFRQTGTGFEAVAIRFEDEFEGPGDEFFVIQISGDDLPVPPLNQLEQTYLAPYDIEELTRDDGLPITSGPYAAGEPLDLRDIDAFQFIGPIGEDVDADRAQFVALLYEAALDRNGDIDEAGLNYWIDAAGTGFTDRQLAFSFTRSQEFIDAYGPITSLTDGEYVTQLYANILDRQPDPNGFEFWLGQLRRVQEEGGNRADFLVFFAGSPENRARSDYVEELMETDPGIWEFPA
ncbi:hypothetical protein LNKW23_28940 [Paralimibaculum aggregatum]|uniref:DUF4214 domain-containing protein n=1 Tax=Paralimibaculum aggregatum TaxID=3036245 RepID=A0ABQ6LMK4_9RHOB|nr:DUF4214 domain-containing protein [Limibaculum sp. NKW23]GMG83681.1 hypothetical protein LNKW23_28940 [Limibaculum sp. NKW23]